MAIEYETVISPHGREIRFAHRNDTNDLSTIGASCTLWPEAGGRMGNEYLLRDHPPMSGWAIDIGAHVGAVTLALAADHPGLNVIAVEALKDNCDMIRASLALNDLPNVEVIEAAASDIDRKRVPIEYGWTTAAELEDAYTQNSRFVGGMLKDPSGRTAYPKGLSLTTLLRSHKIDRVRFMKVDCESCEWQFLTSKDIGRVDEIIGEYHFGKAMNGIHELLDATHTVQHLGGEDTVGLFWAHVR